MFVLFIYFVVPVFLVTEIAFAKECTKEEVCVLVKKMNPFAVLDECPMAAPLIRECKSSDLKEIKKASEISGHSNLLFLRDSLTGKVLAKENKKSIKLNEELHDND